MSVVELPPLHQKGARPADAATGGSSVVKALALLSAVVESHTTARLSDLAVAVDLPKSTTHRLLKALEEAGFIGRAGSRYQVGYRSFELAEAARWSSYGELRDSAQAPLARLFESGGSAVHLAVLEHRDVLYLEKITGRGGCNLPTRVGARMPATCTALGKAILAFSPLSVVRDALEAPLPRITAYSIADPLRLASELSSIREQGVAWEREEGRLGVSCVAAPVLVRGTAIAAVSVSLVGGDVPSVGHAALVRGAAAQIGSYASTASLRKVGGRGARCHPDPRFAPLAAASDK